MTIAIIDTSVFCELLCVPGMDADSEDLQNELRAKLEAGELLLLPMATIIETGNHIGQKGNGAQRRKAAERFVKQVGQAADGVSPFTPTPLVDLIELKKWLDVFPDNAMASRGLGDLSIIKEWERQCDLHTGHQVYIWSKDKHLKGYDRSPA